MLEQMQGLMHLELSGCNDFTEAGLWSSLNARLTSLSVSDCINVADDAIAAISQLLPNLSELSLQAYHVTDTAMAYFTAKQGYTTHTLRLNSCWEITNHGVVNMVHSLPNLTSLSLSGCSKITDDGVELVAENLRKLRSLDLSWCPRITDMALEYIACDLHKLEELILDRWVCWVCSMECKINLADMSSYRASMGVHLVHERMISIIIIMGLWLSFIWLYSGVCGSQIQAWDTYLPCHLWEVSTCAGAVR